MADRTKRLWNIVNKTASERQRREHLFYRVCAVSLLGLLFSAIFDLYIGLPILSLWMVAVTLVLIWVYYQARINGRLNRGVIIFNLLSNVLFVVNYFLNSGIEGPTLLIFLLSIVINIAITNKRYYLYWIALNLFVVCSLLFADFYYPDLVRYNYTERTSKYIDITLSYITIALLITAIIAFIKNNYNLEKISAERRNRELQHSIHTKNKLFSILAHDLRAPFSSLQSYLQILTDSNFDEGEKRIIETDLLAKTKHTSQMLSNLLLWTKTQMEGVKVQLVPVNLSECLAETIQIQTAFATEKNIEVNNLLSDTTTVIADIDMLQLVIRNLVNNAIKFTPVGGRITLSAIEENYKVIIRIEDNGLGIPAEQQEKIFSFNTRPSAGTRKEKGVGLGLVLCKEFTELQGGTIWFESDLGKGTSFYISLGKPHTKRPKADVSALS